MLKLITAAFSQKNTLLITNAHSTLGQEIINQLSIYPYIDIKTLVNIHQPIPDGSITTIIHLPSNQPQLLAEIMGNTSTLYQLLEISKTNNAKFILVVPNTTDHLYQTAIQLVIQFCKTYQLAYQVFEVPATLAVSDGAEAIIKKIVYKHKKKTEVVTPIVVARTPAPAIVQPPPPPPAPVIVEPIPVTPSPVQIPSKKEPTKITLPEISMPSISFPKITLPSISFPKMKVSHTQSRWLFIVGAIVITPWTLFVISNAFLLASIACTYRSFKSNHISRAASCAQAAQILQIGSSFSSYIAIGAQPLAVWAGLPRAETTNVINSVSKSLALSSQLNKDALDYAQNLTTAKEIDSLVSSSDIKTKTGELVESLANLQNDLRSFYTTSSRPPEELNDIAQKIIEMRDIASKAHLAVSDVLPLLEGTSTKKIAILVQDNTELRPSGGYIDSIILLTVENLKITSWRVVTTQFADQQLLGSVEPPADFKTATGQIQWYLRDSNWDIDFRNNANKASWFIQKELNENPDLVIATNIDTLGKIVEIIEPIKFGLSGVTLNSSNIKQEYHTYLKSHTDTNDFLKTVSEKILDKTKSATDEQLEKMIGLISSEIKNRQVLVAIPDKVTPNLDNSGWNGGVGLAKCRSALICVVDMAYIVESNIGVNKADLYTQKNWKSEVQIGETGLKTTFTGTYQNTSTDNSWPSGVYKNYLRVVLPPSSLVETIKVGDKQLKETEYSVTNENGLSVIGFKVEANPGSQTSVVIVTTQSLPLTSGRVHYQLDMPSQPGINISSPVKVSLKYPNTWFATSYTNPVFASAGELEYNLGAKQASTIDIDFAITSTTQK